jgi:hypothetical protein
MCRMNSAFGMGLRGKSMLMRRLAHGAALGVLAVSLASLAHAQETTSGIHGQITDDKGKPLSGVTITVKQVQTGMASTTVTNADGGYDVRNLPPGGPYKVTASGADRPAKSVQVDAIELGAPYALSFSLAAPGAAVSEVVITASSAGGRRAVLTGPRSVFNARDIATLPSFSRDLKDLVARNPFVTIDPTNANALLVAGANNRVNTIYFDGVKQADDFGLNQNGYPTQHSPFSPDWVSQFNFEVAPYDVQYGEFQGGVLNIVTKSGTNEFHGSAFGEYDSNRYAAASFEAPNGAKTYSIAPFRDENWGVTLGGPIIKDKLFFFGGYESHNYLGSPASYGPSDSGVAFPVPGVTTAQINQITSILNNTYHFNPLGYSSILPPQTERKFLAKVDWDVTDRQRVVLEYQENDGVEVLNGGTDNNGASSPALDLLSQYYALDQNLKAYSVQLYSQWTDNFRTTFEYSHKAVDSIRAPLAGSHFASFTIVLPPATLGATPTKLTLGPDISSQANILDNTDQLIKLKGDYTLGDHVITLGYERDQLQVFNEFVQNANGSYTFAYSGYKYSNGVICGGSDVFTNLTNQSACALTYANASDNVSTSGAANWGDIIHTAYLQDEWSVRPDLTLRAGLRDEYYQGATTPGLNPRFLAQYGFPNTATFNGMNILMPRVGFNWRPDPSLSVTGGFGLFSGGSPNVWLSNSFTNTGNLLGSVTCLPTQAANPTLASPTACASALQGVTGTSVGQAAQTANTNSTLAGIGVVNAVDPHFRPPSTWKASLSVVKEFDLPYVGPGWRVHADYLYEKVQDGVTWVDLWARQNPGAPAPDGRETYNVARFTNALGRNTGYDLMLTNDHGGGGSVIAVGLANAWKDGWLKGVDFDLTYTHEDIKEVNPGTSSVALSNYSQWATADRNQPDVGVSNYNIKDQVKFILGYRRAFFGDYNTSIQFMLDRRSGLPYSFTFDQTSSPGGTGSLSSGAGFDNLFGESGSVAYRNTQLLYVPATDSSGNVTRTSDSKVTYAPGFDIAGFNAFLKQTGLIKYAGEISPKNAFTSRGVTFANMRLSQELPAFFPGAAKFTAYMDLINIGNMINPRWGVLEQYGFPYVLPSVTAKNCQATGPMYSAHTGTCALGAGNYYEYDSYIPLNSVAKSGSNSPTYDSSSGWQIKFGLKYAF